MASPMDKSLAVRLRGSRLAHGVERGGGRPDGGIFVLPRDVA
jgi:hypothetical protein